MNQKLTVGFLVLTGMILSACDNTDGTNIVSRYSTDKCAVDSIAGKPDAIVYIKPGKLEISGWAFDDFKHTTSGELEIHMAGAQGEPIIVKNPSRISRPDLVKAFNNSALDGSGFIFTIDTSALPRGAYGLTVDTRQGKALFVCQSKKFVVII